VICAKLWDLNQSLLTKVKNLGAAEPIHDKELAVSHQAIVKLEEETLIVKHHSAKLARQLNKCKSEPEPTEQTTVNQFHLQKVMLMQQVKKSVVRETCA
jgi:hypothetical protein